ncbi:ATP-NAD kinase [Ramaria rubella]|nr:ATP-NAD kinase [Ramaria rubella]
MSATSPDSETFSTPPTTPTTLSSITDHGVPHASLSRRSSGRPSSLSIQHSSGEWTPDIVLDEPVSDLPSMLSSSSEHSDNLKQPIRSLQGSPNIQGSAQHRLLKQPLKSPCFVHSLLDKGASFQDWLQQTRLSNSTGLSRSLPNSVDDPVLLQRSPSLPMPQPPSQESPPSSVDDEEEYDDFEGTGSLTRQLAETAVGVREMSKQLGRARVKANIQSVMIITKARDNRLIKLTRELALYLMVTPRGGGRGLIVYVDSQLRYSKRFDAEGIERDHPELFIPSPKRRTSSSNSLASLSSESRHETRDRLKDDFKGTGQLRYWTSDMCSRSPQLFDFVVTLGGDGTVLFTSWLFQRIVPPVLPFALGSLGFLTNFDFSDHQVVMDSAIESGIRVNLRMRFTCTVYRAVAPEKGKGRKAVKKGETGEIMMKNIGKEGWEALEGGWAGGGGNAPVSHPKDKEIMCFTTRPVESFEVINELVVDRGPSPYVSLLELFGDEHHMTTVQADGLTVSTPTGSTAYSLSAGGSLVHPEIPALLITPICPHTLSFRPMLLPDSMELRICVPYNSRSTAWASFDGRGRVELKQGDHIKVTASKYPFPTVCADKQSTDWFHAISRTLKWNERERQKSFVVVEEGPVKANKKQAFKMSTEDSVKEDPSEDVEDDDEPEEKFDIDDSNSETHSEPEAKLKAREQQKDAQNAVAAMMRNSTLHESFRSHSNSGIDSPDRFAGPIPHPHPISPRHVPRAEIFTPSPSPDLDERRIDGENGDRDDIHSPRAVRESSKSKIPRNRDFDAETPRAHEHAHSNLVKRVQHAHVSAARLGSTSHHHHPPSQHHVRQHRSLSVDGGARRAFAVWGHDESDSNTSDSDSQA